MTDLVDYDGKQIESLEYGDYEKIDLVTFEHDLSDASTGHDETICNYTLDGYLIDGLQYTALMTDRRYNPILNEAIWTDAILVIMDWDTIRDNQYEGVYWNRDGYLKAVNGIDGADTDQFEYTLLHENNRLTGLTLLLGRYNADGVRIGGREISLMIPMETDRDLDTYSNICVSIDPSAPTIMVSSSHVIDDDEVYDSYLDELDPVTIDKEPLRELEHDLDLIDIDSLINTTENQYTVYNDNGDW